MKQFLIASFAVAIITSILVFANPHQANALPFSYNLTQFTIPFSTYTRAGFDALMEAGYNGTVTSVYQARSSNTTLNYEFGYHPTLILSVDTFNNITASASVAATQSLPITIASGHNNVALVVGIVFEHTTNNDHNKARMSSVTIAGFPMTMMINKTVTCGTASCDSEIWVLGNNTALTGAQTITITPSDVTNYHMVAGVYSLYNARSIRPIDAMNSATGTSVTPSVTITKNFPSAMSIDNMLTLQTGTPSAPSHAKRWVGHTAILTGASQSGISSASGATTMQWTTTNVQWISTGVEVIPIQDSLNNFGFNLAFQPDSNFMAINNSKFYYPAFSGAIQFLNHIDTNTGVETHDISLSEGGGVICNSAGSRTGAVFISENKLFGYCSANTANGLTKSTLTTNTTITNTAQSSPPITSNLKIYFPSSPFFDRYNSNSSTTMLSSGTSNLCELNYQPNNTTTPIDNVGCDAAIPNHVNRFWNGMYLTRNNNYYYNSTLAFLGTTDLQTYKKALTIPASIYNIPDPDVKMVGHFNGVDYLISLSSTTIKYVPMNTITSILSSRATQAYEITNVNTDSHYYLSPSSISPLVSIKIYGPGLNQTVSKYGLLTIPSGYLVRTTASLESIIRPLDPRWTNTPQNDIPAISTTGSQFPMFITVSNAPTDSSMMLTDPAQTINNINSAWCVTQLDSTRTAECDIPANQCALVYVADISVTPTIFTYEGSVCATGSTTKTLAYTNTLPLTFYTLRYGATHSYAPTTNGLSVTTRSSTAPYTYNILIKNSTGAITQNFTTTINGTIDTHNFNITNATKPAGLFVSVPGVGQIYSAYIGSPLSFASTVSFFHQYLSYQGFDLLSFIPLIFAAMFTRNTVGIGTALVVVLIATLSFLSVVVVSDTVVVVSMIVAVLGLIGYRGFAG